MASANTIMTAEQIIPTENIRTYPNLTEIPFTAVDALVEQRFASYPARTTGTTGSTWSTFSCSAAPRTSSGKPETQTS
jgi:glutaconate CoA-transferase subunit A